MLRSTFVLVIDAADRPLHGRIGIFVREPRMDLNKTRI